MRRRIVAGNWKMNLNRSEALELAGAISGKAPEGVELMIFPSTLYLDEIIRSSNGIDSVGAQNFHYESNGAYTGEISLEQLKSVGTGCVLIGHSERRELFHETNTVIKHKVDAALNASMPFIFCCGEPLNMRKSGRAFDFVRVQMEESLFHLNADAIADVVIAYEPIWAIGTGETATSEQAEEMHSAIRGWLADTYGEAVARFIPILYGGSCKPSNAKELFACPNVDGGLIGGAALNADDFIAIANSF